MPRDTLGLHEEVVLLALRNEKGTPAASMHAYALAGAILTELLLADRIGLEHRRRGQPLVDVVRATQTGDPVLDDALERIRRSKRRAALDRWVSRFARTATMHATAVRLSRKGILGIEEKRVLLLFSRTVYPEVDPGPERALVERLRRAIFGQEPVDGRTAALVALAHAAGLLRTHFPARELKARKARIRSLTEGHEVADATRAAVAAVQAAVVAAAAAGSVAATAGG